MCLSLPAVVQAAGAVVVTEHVRAELLAHAPQGIQPGKPVTLGLLLAHQPHWHTYWKNPGDSGLATTLSWTLPPGFTAAEIAWPAPKRLPLGPLVNYGYEGQVLLPVSITVPASHTGAVVKVALHAEWLVCKEICLPESGDFTLELPVNSPVTQHRAQFDAARAAAPATVAGASASARVQSNALAFEVRGLPPAAHGKALQFFAEDAGVIDYAGTTEQQWQNNVLSVRVPLSAQRSESPATLRAVLALEGQSRGWAVTAPVRGGWPDVGAGAAPLTQASAGNAAGGVPSGMAASGAAVPATMVPAASGPAGTLADVGADAAPPAFLLSLLFAFIGGALLNLMPCVFPVLSLKIFGFTQHAGERRKAVAGGLAYTAGVVLSFTALAGLLLALRAGGAQLGWGFQLQSPAVVAVLSALFTLIGLNLAGVFEFGALLPGAVAGYRAKNPLLDDALSGVLAVAVASPCTAPFMGAALGVALTEPAPRALAVFAVLGLGMAAPYLLAALSPQLARLLPKPGAWMLRFKTMMAFPMFATVVWLLWVLGQQTSIDAMAGMAGLLVALAYACWTLHTPIQSRRTRTVLATTGVLALVATVSQVWPLLQAEHATAEQAQRQVSGPWAPWSADAVAQARLAGKPVFVDFTAAWCVTCQFNKRTVLNDQTLMAEFNARQVVLLRADWTRRDPAITRQLAQLGRSGVPVYALYGAGNGQPHVLSELLTVEKVRAALGSI